ncbi:hypothetical protein ACLB2K_011989 [Fragaria x ananassa]
MKESSWVLRNSFANSGDVTTMHGTEPRREKASRWWRGREREDGSESGSDVSKKDSGWEREGVEGRGERRRVWWSRAAEERERMRVKKLMIQNEFGIALWALYEPNCTRMKILVIRGGKRAGQSNRVSSRVWACP